MRRPGGFTDIFSSPNVLAVNGKFSFGPSFEDEVDGGFRFDDEPGVQRLLRRLRLLHVNALYEISISSAPESAFHTLDLRF